ncbi:MAG: hypothetical protein QGG14_08860, partial [Planctomycetota bacterium]|nr:hypothetical protein [Planctomycetota bacterium]
RRMRSPIVYCGPMWGGKTEALISRLVRARLMDIETLAFNPVRNDRYGTTDIVAHSGATFPARAVATGQDLLDHVAAHRPQVVGIDEFFMIDAALDAVVELAAQDIKVVVATLDMDSEGKPWDSVGELLAMAEEVVKCPAVCATCKKDGFYTFRKGAAPAERVLVGTADFYEPRCFACWRCGQDAKRADAGAESLFGG